MRESVRLYRVPVAPGVRTVSAPSLELVLPVATDVETLLADPVSGRLHLVTKRITGGVVWAVPADARVGQTRRVRTITRVSSWATDGVVLPGGRHVVLRDYLGGQVLDYPSFEPRGPLALPPDRQGEAIAAIGPRRVVTVGEGATPRLRETRIPARLLTASPSASPSSSASPSGSSSESGSAPVADTAASDLWGRVGAVAGGVGGVALGLLLGWAVFRRRRR